MRFWRTAALLVTFAVVASPSESTAGDEKRTIEAIENDLVADDPAVRAKAAAELTDRFPDGAVAVPMLVDLLDDESPDVVTAAAKTIDAMAAPAASVLAKRFPAGSKPSKELESLMLLGPGVPSVVFSLGPEEVGLDAAIAAALVEVRSSVANALYLGPRDLSDEPIDRAQELFWLTRAARDTDATLSSVSAASLAIVAARHAGVSRLPQVRRGHDAAAVRELTGLLESTEPVRAFVGARLLAAVRPESPAAVNALIKVVANGSASSAVRRAAARALAAIGPAARGAIPTLRNKVSSMRGGVAQYEFEACVEALVRVEGERELSDLLSGDPDRRMDVVPVVADLALAPDVIVPLLMIELERGEETEVINDRYVRLALGNYGSKAAAAVPRFRASLARATDETQRLGLVEVILAIDPSDQAANRELVTVLDGATKRYDYAVQIASGRAGLPVSTVKRILRKVEEGADSWIQLRYVAALGRCSPPAADAVPRLLECASTLSQGFDKIEHRRKYKEFRQVYAATFGSIGPAASAAVPLLESWRDKSDETIRVPAAQAIRRIKAKK